MKWRKRGLTTIFFADESKTDTPGNQIYLCLHKKRTADSGRKVNKLSDGHCTTLNFVNSCMGVPGVPFLSTILMMCTVVYTV